MNEASMNEAQFFHPDLSWLRFNERVLAEALDERLPLLERAKFMAIVSANLDEFVMVRLALLSRRRGPQAVHPSGLSLQEQKAQVRAGVADQMARQYAGFAALRSQLVASRLALVDAEHWSEQETHAADAYFRRSLELTVTPLAVGPSHPFPLVGNLQLFLALELVSQESGQMSYALVGVPSNEPRLIQLSAGRFGLLEDVLKRNVRHLFPGLSVKSCGVFRVTRDGSMDIDEDQTTDLLSEVEQGLRSRGRGRAIRLEIDKKLDAGLRQWLRTQLELSAVDLVEVDGPLDLTLLFRLASAEHVPESSRFPEHRPAYPRLDLDDPFSELRLAPLLLHHPYQSFDVVVGLVQRAAADPRVVAIKQTLYRVSGESPIVEALIDAAENGKQVTVLCELKARFDEHRNITWARRLEEAGAHVLYGVIGYKVHAKLLLIIRRDEDGVRRYVHLGTGNYNDKTARIYEDFSLLTTNEAICRDVANLFNMLTGFSRPPEWERLLVAPLTFRSTMQEWIRREADHARAGRWGRIFAKCNSLEDTEICQELYAASQAGVSIDLVIRGLCVLRPGVKGLSENIRVHSVVGQFLEHSRFYYFSNSGEPEYVLGSGDWMTRNLDRRVENLLRVTEPSFRAYLDWLRELYLEDKRNTYLLQPDGRYLRLGEHESSLGLQQRLQQRHREQAVSTPLPEPAFAPARKLWSPPS